MAATDATLGTKPWQRGDGRATNAWHGHFEPKRVPEGVWMRCEGCQATLFRKQVDENLGVCPDCNHHFSLSASQRIAQLFDADTFEEWFAGLQPLDPLGFNDRRPYPERIRAEQERTGLPRRPLSARGSSRGSASSSASPTAVSSWGAWARSSAKN